MEKLLIIALWIFPFILRHINDAGLIPHGCGFKKNEWEKIRPQAVCAEEAEGQLKMAIIVTMMMYIFSGLPVGLMDGIITLVFLFVHYFGSRSRKSYFLWAEKFAEDPSTAWPPDYWAYKFFFSPHYVAKRLEYLLALSLTGSELTYIAKTSYRIDEPIMLLYAAYGIIWAYSVILYAIAEKNYRIFTAKERVVMQQRQQTA